MRLHSKSMEALSKGALIHKISTTQLNPTQTKLPNFKSKLTFRVNCSSNPDSQKNPIIQKLQNASKVLIFTAATALMINKLSHSSRKPVLTKEQVLSDISEMVNSKPSAKLAMLSMIDAHIDAGDYKKAVQVALCMIAVQPKELYWKYLLGRLFQLMGELGRARKVYEEVYEKDNNYADVFFHMAEIMVYRGEYEPAVRMYEEKVKIAQDQEEARRMRIGLAKLHFTQKNLDKALMSFEELVEEDPKDWELLMYLSVCYRLSNRNVEAEILAGKCREVCPKDINVDLVFGDSCDIKLVGVSIR